MPVALGPVLAGLRSGGAHVLKKLTFRRANVAAGLPSTGLRTQVAGKASEILTKIPGSRAASAYVTRLYDNLRGQGYAIAQAQGVQAKGRAVWNALLDISEKHPVLTTIGVSGLIEAISEDDPAFAETLQKELAQSVPALGYDINDLAREVGVDNIEDLEPVLGEVMVTLMNVPAAARESEAAFAAYIDQNFDQEGNYINSPTMSQLPSPMAVSLTHPFSSDIQRGSNMELERLSAEEIRASRREIEHVRDLTSRVKQLRASLGQDNLMTLLSLLSYEKPAEVVKALTE